MNTRNRYATERIGEPPTVLIVDDEVRVRSFEAQLLSSQGYNVLQADSGAEALRLADNATIHLLLTDFLMPEVDGLELTQKFRTVQPQTPVLMVSGSLLPTDSRIKNLTNFGFLHKPFAFDELVLKVRTMIQAETPVHGEFVNTRLRSGDPALLPCGPMLLKLLAYGKCDCFTGFSARQTGRSSGAWRNPDGTG
jgi:DNA-binding response OmpR family regulator